MLQITGVLKVKNNEQVVSDRFKKREFVLTDNASQYPQYILFQLTQDKCALLDAINVGEEITVFFNLKGREWKSPQGEIKFFNSLEAWKIDKAASKPTTTVDTPMATIQELPDDYKDDLPF
jgi:hypothetical protein